jgi:ABC-type multidrug transport system ATPase subunit
MTALKISGMHKKFGDIALDGLDLEAQSGEIFALLGPSASNKTTTQRTICGIEFLAASS